MEICRLPSLKFSPPVQKRYQGHKHSISNPFSPLLKNILPKVPSLREFSLQRAESFLGFKKPLVSSRINLENSSLFNYYQPLFFERRWVATVKQPDDDVLVDLPQEVGVEGEKKTKIKETVPDKSNEQNKPNEQNEQNEKKEQNEERKRLKTLEHEKIHEASNSLKRQNCFVELNWTHSQVNGWARRNGFNQTDIDMMQQLQFTGKDLMTATEKDFRKKNISIDVFAAAVRLKIELLSQRIAEIEGRLKNLKGKAGSEAQMATLADYKLRMERIRKIKRLLGHYRYWEPANMFLKKKQLELSV